MNPGRSRGPWSRLPRRLVSPKLGEGGSAWAKAGGPWSLSPWSLCLLSLVLALPLTTLPASAQTTIQNTTYASGQDVMVSDSTIAANTNVTVSSGAIVKYRATTSVTLGPGFTAQSGSNFRAFLFIDSDSDGMEDAWELQYFGNLNQGAFGDYDGDGLSNFGEYTLGTNPTVANASNPSINLSVHRPN